MNTYLICYDISDDHERNRVFRLLKRHANPVQESVFELQRCSDSRLRQLQTRLAELVSDPHTLRFYRLTQDALAGSRDLAGRPLGRRPLFVIL